MDNFFMPVFEVRYLCLRQPSGRRHRVFRVFVRLCVSPEQTFLGMLGICWWTLAQGWMHQILGSRSRWGKICTKMHFLALL